MSTPSTAAPGASISAPPPPSRELVTLRGLWQALSGWHLLFVISVACNVISLIAAAVALAAGAWAVSLAALGGTPSQLVGPAAVTAAAVVVRSVTAWLETWLSHDLAFRMLARTRLWIYDAIARIAPAGLQRRRTGDLLTSSMADAESLEIYYAHSSIYAVSAWVSTPLLWAGLALVSLPAALAVIPVILAVVGITVLARRWAVPQGRRIRVALAELGAEVSEEAGAVREIVGFGLAERRRAVIADADAELSAAQFRNARRAGAETAAHGVVALVAGLAAAAAVGWQHAAGTLDPQLVPVAIILAVASTSAVLQWGAMTRHYGGTKQAAERISALLRAEPPVEDHGQIHVDERAGDPVDVRADDVSFSWNSVDADAADRRAVTAVSVGVEPGQSVAVCGRSGAGKSTFGQLLARFIDPVAGTLSVDGHDLRDVSRDHLPDLVSLLPQDVALFQETVRDNLLLATDDRLSDAELWEALTLARADEIVRQLPDGLDAVLIENGASLSGGERQRLALARAVIHPTAVLILDESVSQLDVYSERSIHEALAHVREGQTTITIAHRLSTLLRSARILVMDEGRLVGDGTHDDLLSSCDEYRRLVLPQLEAARSRE